MSDGLSLKSMAARQDVMEQNIQRILEALTGKSPTEAEEEVEVPKPKKTQAKDDKGYMPWNPNKAAYKATLENVRAWIEAEKDPKQGYMGAFAQNIHAKLRQFMTQEQREGLLDRTVMDRLCDDGVIVKALSKGQYKEGRKAGQTRWTALYFKPEDSKGSSRNSLPELAPNTRQQGAKAMGF